MVRSTKKYTTRQQIRLAEVSGPERSALAAGYGKTNAINREAAADAKRMVAARMTPAKGRGTQRLAKAVAKKKSDAASSQETRAKPCAEAIMNAIIDPKPMGEITASGGSVPTMARLSYTIKSGLAVADTPLNDTGGTIIYNIGDTILGLNCSTDNTGFFTMFQRTPQPGATDGDPLVAQPVQYTPYCFSELTLDDAHKSIPDTLRPNKMTLSLTNVTDVLSRGGLLYILRCEQSFKLPDGQDANNSCAAFSALVDTIKCHPCTQRIGAEELSELHMISQFPLDQSRYMSYAPNDPSTNQFCSTHFPGGANYVLPGQRWSRRAATGSADWHNWKNSAAADAIVAGYMNPVVSPVLVYLEGRQQDKAQSYHFGCKTVQVSRFAPNDLMSAMAKPLPLVTNAQVASIRQEMATDPHPCKPAAGLWASIKSVGQKAYNWYQNNKLTVDGAISTAAGLLL